MASSVLLKGLLRELLMGRSDCPINRSSCFGSFSASLCLDLRRLFISSSYENTTDQLKRALPRISVNYFAARLLVLEDRRDQVFVLLMLLRSLEALFARRPVVRMVSCR